MLTRNHRQEALSRAYVQAIAAYCGMSVSVPYPDYGIDMTLNEIEIANGRRGESGHKLDVQAKSTTRASRAENTIYYDLDLRSYEMLRRSSRGSPRILVVFQLPRDESHWCNQTVEALILRHCAYWISLRGWPAIANRRSIRLSMGPEQVFSPDALRAIMDRIRKGETP